MESSPVLLIGASCRAAAQSLQRLGIPAIAWDMFADRDTKLVCEVRQIDSLNSARAYEILELDRSIVLPCGGLENAAPLWNELSRRHCMLGPSSDQLTKLRDPFWLSGICNSNRTSILFPESKFTLDSLDPDKTWLVKNPKSAGGLAVRYLTESSTLAENELAQEFISGTEFGVTVRCTGKSCSILFATVPFPIEALALEEGRDFSYTGSIGPIALPDTVKKQIEEFFSVLSRELKFTGVLQADLVQNADKTYLLEINPRWTAGMEIGEILAPGMLLKHFESQSGDRLFAASSEPTPTTDEFVVKQIIYARKSFVVTKIQSCRFMALAGWAAIDNAYSVKPGNDSEWSQLHFRLADIPEPHSKFENGYPVCTLLIRGRFRDGDALELNSIDKFYLLKKLADDMNPLEQVPTRDLSS